MMFSRGHEDRLGTEPDHLRSLVRPASKSDAKSHVLQNVESSAAPESVFSAQTIDPQDMEVARALLVSYHRSLQEFDSVTDCAM